MVSWMDPALTIGR